MNPLWNTLTSADVLKRFTQKEAADLNAVAGTADGLTQIVLERIQNIRGRIKAGGRQLGPDGTLPDSLRDLAIDLCVWDWVTSPSGNSKVQTDVRREKAREARDTLKLLAQGELPVELPDAGELDSVASGVNAIQTVAKRPQEAAFKRTRGL